jgi:hypothetical protein
MKSMEHWWNSIDEGNSKYSDRNLHQRYFFPPYGSTAPWGPRPPHFRGFVITLFRRTTLGRTPLYQWPSQRPLPDNTQHSQETDIHAPGGIRTHNPSKRAAVGPPSVTLSASNLTRNGLRQNPCCRGERPSTNRLEPWHALKSRSM